ncbi:MAG TPA: ArsI/CadI family heavy metal resistance metalloenzyme [Thermoanaerobaculia bacterium]|nr:ArsI/CadI family heavy metal resistance metalloenzyme [Thermoanaerobaculia bacterium]
MKRLHVMLQVKELDESIRFYTALFGAEPTKRKTEYAKWMLDDPRVNFSIAAHGDATGIERLGLEHLGIQAESREEMAELRERVARSGGRVADEGETTCCYAESDKAWVTDPQGVSWEAFFTHGEAETYHAPAAAGRGDACCAEPAPEAACCGPACCTDGAPAADCCAADCCAA